MDFRINQKLGVAHELWTTLEGENPGGSIKDRMVRPELLQLKARGVSRVSEISSGSTALSLAFYCQEFDLKCDLFVPIGLDEAIKAKLLKSGADLIECPAETAYEEYEDFCRSSKAWRFGQMQRKGLRLHYQNWAEEQLMPRLPAFDFVIGAVGTSHSLLGTKQALKPKSGCIAAEPKPECIVNGVRNLTRQNFGPKDPCELHLIDHRLEIPPHDYFEDRHFISDVGPISISDSFRLTLGAAISFLADVRAPSKVFLIGSECKLLEK